MISKYAIQIMIETNPSISLSDFRYDIMRLQLMYTEAAMKTELMILDDQFAPDYSIRNALVDDFGMEDLDESRLNTCVQRFAELYYSLPISGNYKQGF